MVITLLQNCCVRIITNVEAQHEIVLMLQKRNREKFAIEESITTINKRSHEKSRQKQLPPGDDAALGKILTHKFHLTSKRLKIRININATLTDVFKYQLKWEM